MEKIITSSRVCFEMKEALNISDEEFNLTPVMQIGIRCETKDVMFTGRMTPSAASDFTEHLINNFGEIRWPGERGHYRYANKVLTKNKSIFCISWDPCFKWDEERIIEGPDLINEGLRVKWI